MNIIKKTGKYIIKKVSKSAVGKAVRWGFWGALCFFGPTSVIGAVGIQGLIVGAIVTHSGIIEYSTGKVIESKVLVEE